MGIADKLMRIKEKLPENVKLVAVSKTKPAEFILEAYNCGHRCFGENRPQELKQKYEQLPTDIEWHFIGHLQTNKIKYIAPFVALIHSVDSFNLLTEINKEAAKCNRVIDCLLQFYIAREETKFGFNTGQAAQMLSSDSFKLLKNIRVTGVMGMATYTDDDKIVSAEFEYLNKVFKYLKNNFFANSDYFNEISMGMSGDYKLAIEQGSTIVRIGSSIFGNR